MQFFHFYMDTLYMDTLYCIDQSFGKQQAIGNT